MRGYWRALLAGSIVAALTSALPVQAEVPPEIAVMIQMLKAQGQGEVAAMIERMAEGGNADFASIMEAIQRGANQQRPAPAPPAAVAPAAAPPAAKAPAAAPPARPPAAAATTPAPARPQGPGQEVHFRLLIVKTQAEAQAIVAELQRGGDFAAIARKKSIDADTARDGGDLGWQKMEAFGPDMAGAVTRMKPGFVIPPFQTPFGWNVMRFEGVRGGATPAPREQAASGARARKSAGKLTGYVAVGRGEPHTPVCTAEDDDDLLCGHTDFLGKFEMPFSNFRKKVGDKVQVVVSESREIAAVVRDVAQAPDSMAAFKDKVISHCQRGSNDYSGECSLARAVYGIDDIHRPYPVTYCGQDGVTRDGCAMFGAGKIDDENSDSHAHVTPVTTVAIAAAAKTGSGATTVAGIAKAPIDDLAKLKAGFAAFLGPEYKDVDVFSDPGFMPDPELNKYDKLLEAIKFSTKGDTVVARDINGKILASAPMANIVNNTIRGSDQSITSEKARAAEGALDARRAALRASSEDVEITPKRAMVDQPTIFTIRGKNLTDEMSINLESCGDLHKLPGGTSTMRQFSCKPLYPAPRTGFLKDQPGGTTFYIFHVLVERPAGGPAARAPNAVQPAAASTSASLGSRAGGRSTMTLSTPFGRLTNFEFPEGPTSFSKNELMAQLGLSQSLIQFKSTTSIPEEASANMGPGPFPGPIRITVQENGSSGQEDIAIRIDSATSNGTKGELVPVQGGGMCHVSGSNPQSFPSCASLGIAFNKKAGTLTFTNTSLYSGYRDTLVTKIIALSLNFPPY